MNVMESVGDVASELDNGLVLLPIFELSLFISLFGCYKLKFAIFNETYSKQLKKASIAYEDFYGILYSSLLLYHNGSFKKKRLLTPLIFI